MIAVVPDRKVVQPDWDKNKSCDKLTVSYQSHLGTRLFTISDRSRLAWSDQTA